MNPEKIALLKALDISVWKQRPLVNTDLTSSSQVLCLEKLSECVSTCQLCPLHSTRTQTVFGTGHKHAELMIIGEAPGFYEDQQGEPFVGRAGKLLNAMLHSIGFSRRDVYIANILKCRPPNNRDPLPQEVSACTSYLEQQIALVQPKVLCALGRIAGHYLLQTTEPLNRLRHKKHVYGADNRRLFITYHPAYLLRNPLAKAEAYRDLLQLKECL